MCSGIIRQASLDDIESICAIYNDAILNTTATFDIYEKTIPEIKAWLLSHDERHPVCVVEIKGSVVAWGSISKCFERAAYADMSEISIYVASAYRRRGLGKRILSWLIEQSRLHKFHTLIGFITGANTASISLLNSCGFTYVGTMKEVGIKFYKRLDLEIWQFML